MSIIAVPASTSAPAAPQDHRAQTEVSEINSAHPYLTLANLQKELASEKRKQEEAAKAKAEAAAEKAEEAERAKKAKEAEKADEAREAKKAAEAEKQENDSAARKEATAEVVQPTTGTLTSQFGMRGGSPHNGIDIANSIGTPILSAMDGKVIDSGAASGFGMWVRVQHARGLVTVYGHVNESMVSVGEQVSAGEQIATVGNRGQSTGPHLHFEVQQSGSKTDPLSWLQRHGVSI
ncbi:M23 family metallopeptidase [Amycolatopsis marina]|uniref:M23 family metallopeptidase n=1 Tax=Amycolatopsis marina TaxID=490629 RepID=UPI001FE50E01|nr:M23 family metallopeptidase [Amycolatopsis marina]